MAETELGLTRDEGRKVEDWPEIATPAANHDEGELRRKIVSCTINVPKHEDPKLVHHLDGHYIIRHSHIPFASGGFCDIFIGEHPQYGKVAMRRPRMTMEGYSTSQMKNFCIETEIWKKLRHPYILQFIGLIQSDGHVWAVSRFAEDGSLPIYLKGHPDTDRRMLVVQLADAIAYLHQMGVVHGDIKGSNILISAAATVLLCDFGLSKLAGTPTVSSLEGAASIRWCAPEVLFDGETKSSASDVWSFGMTIYEILSGNVPFHDVGNDFLAVFNAIKDGRRPLRELATQDSKETYEPLWDIASESWDDKPSQRPNMDTVIKRLGVSIGPSCGISDMGEPSITNDIDFRPSTSSSALVLHSSLPLSMSSASQCTTDADSVRPTQHVASYSIEAVGSDTADPHIPFELFEQEVKNIRPPLGARLIDPTDFSPEDMDEPVTSNWPPNLWCAKCRKRISRCWHCEPWWDSVVPTKIGNVKRLVKIYSPSAGGQKAFLSDLKQFGKWMHKNFLHIKGFSYSGSMPFLVLSPARVRPLKAFIQDIGQDGGENLLVPLLKSMSGAWKASRYLFGECLSEKMLWVPLRVIERAVVDERGNLLLSLPAAQDSDGPWLQFPSRHRDADGTSSLREALLVNLLEAYQPWDQRYTVIVEYVAGEEKSARDDLQLLLYKLCQAEGLQRVQEMLEAYQPSMDLTSVQHLLSNAVSSRYHKEFYYWPFDAVVEPVRSTQGAYDYMIDPGDIGYFVRDHGTNQCKSFIKLENISREIGRVHLIGWSNSLEWMDHTGGIILSNYPEWDDVNKNWVLEKFIWCRRLKIIAKTAVLLQICRRVAMKYRIPASKLVIVQEVQCQLGKPHALMGRLSPDTCYFPSRLPPTFHIHYGEDGKLYDWYWSSSAVPGADRLYPSHPTYQAWNLPIVIADKSTASFNEPTSIYIPLPSRLDEALLNKGLLPKEESDDDEPPSFNPDDHCGLLDAANCPILRSGFSITNTPTTKMRIRGRG